MGDGAKLVAGLIVPRNSFSSLYLAAKVNAEGFRCNPRAGIGGVNPNFEKVNPPCYGKTFIPPPPFVESTPLKKTILVRKGVVLQACVVTL